MTLSTVTVTWNVEDISLEPLGGTVSFQLSALAADSADGTVVALGAPVLYNFAGGTGTSEPLTANDNASLSPAGTYYQVKIVTGGQSYAFSAQLNAANGASQTLAYLIANQAQPVAQYAQYLPLTTGTPAAGKVPVFTGDGYATVPGDAGGSGTVTSVNGQDPDGSGNVTLTAAEVGAASTDALSTEATTRSAADTTLAGAITTEATNRANADALLVPLTQRGAASGVATLDSSSHVPAVQLALALLSGGPLTTAVTSVSADYTAVAGDSVILASASSAAVTVTIPSPAGIAGRQLTVIKSDAVTNQVKVQAASGNVGGSSSIGFFFQYDNVTVVSDGTTWQVTGRPMTQGTQTFNGSKQFAGGIVVPGANTTTASLNTGLAVKTASYTLGAADCTVLLNGSGLTATLPTASNISGRIYTVKLVAAATTGTVATTSSQTIDGASSYTLSAQNKYVTVVSDGANWQITANN